ncbi:helix-turn-helix transcriptional regulator [Albidovulum sediminis]|uniref:AlpA family transcriptional regulator n=1 Tax=Albidovulum sediminis TaxID=3066345 RepID=A0ABT2NPQ4_9RHOB|nr:AlpA family transcriptional regulator [Defluviimonas sediminis]MCT8330911.1 AlpA family transcriptional regulator [Defluviimonas sediminis]
MPSNTARLLRRPEVLSLTGMSRSTLYASMTLGLFPRPVRIGAQAVAWREADVLHWIETRPEVDAA